jgi:hypothetical protein
VWDVLILLVRVIHRSFAATVGLLPLGDDQVEVLLLLTADSHSFFLALGLLDLLLEPHTPMGNVKQTMRWRRKTETTSGGSKIQE